MPAKKPAKRATAKPVRKSKPAAKVAKAAKPIGKPARPTVDEKLALELAAPSPEARAKAIAKLRGLGPVARQVVALAARSISDRPPKQRAPLALSIARLDRDHLPAALPVLAELIAIGASSDRALVREILELVPALGVNAVPLLPAMLVRLEQASKDESEAIVAAVNSAGSLGADALHHAAKNSKGAFGAKLVKLLDDFDSPDHILALGELSRHSDTEVRRAAIAALGRRRTREAVPDLLRALEDPDTEIATAAQAELRGFSGPVLAPVLTSYFGRLRQDTPEKRNRAVVAAAELGVAGFEDSGPLLLDALGDSSPAIRARAAQGLLAVAPNARAALPRLRAQRKDGSPMVRTAVEAAITAIERSPR